MNKLGTTVTAVALTMAAGTAAYLAMNQNHHGRFSGGKQLKKAASKAGKVAENLVENMLR